MDTPIQNTNLVSMSCTGPGVALKEINGTPVCIKTGVDQSCPANEALRGFDANGVKICEAY